MSLIIYTSEGNIPFSVAIFVGDICIGIESFLSTEQLVSIPSANTLGYR